MPNPARRLWPLYEQIHAVVYFTDEARQAADQAGYRGFWMGYFALRLAPLGAIGAAAATAICYGFHPSRVARALPDAWCFGPPQVALTARLAGADAALRRLWGERVRGAQVREAAELAWAAAEAAQPTGRVLGAANQALPRPDDPHLMLWQAATTLREHRGDGHNSVLLAADVGPAQAHLLKAAADETDLATLRLSRQWPDEAWQQARDELSHRGWLDGHGRLTAAGADARAEIEAGTDAAAASPWRALGPARTDRLADLLAPLASAVVAAGAFPLPSPIGFAAAG